MLALTESNDVFGAVVSDPEAWQDLAHIVISFLYSMAKGCGDEWAAEPYMLL